MQWQGNFIFKHIIGVRVILDICSECFISCHHRKGLIVHIRCYALLRHLRDDDPPLLIAAAGHSGDIEMSGGCVGVREVNDVIHAQFIADSIVLCNDLSAACQKSRISLQLLQADRRHDVGHVALIERRYDIVLPRTQLGFRQRILALSVQAQELEPVIDLIVVDSINVLPGSGAALTGSEVLPSWSVGITPRCRFIIRQTTIYSCFGWFRVASRDNVHFWDGSDTPVGIMFIFENCPDQGGQIGI